MMNQLKMVDTVAQYKQYQNEIDIAMQSVLESGHYIKGSTVQLFERNLAHYLDVRHVISCGNGTDALQIALMALNLEPGDEIITTAFTFAATAEVIALLGLKPVFVDISPSGDFMMDVNQVEANITSRTKVVMPVHLFGQCANMEAILQIAEKYELKIIEDNAQSLGAVCKLDNQTKKKAGAIGDIGCTSFYPSKVLGAFGDGGALFTNSDTMAERIRMITNHGTKRKYYHEIIGVNSRLDALQAAVLNIKLKYLDKESVERHQIANLYDKLLINEQTITVPYRTSLSSHVFHQYSILCERRDELKTFLDSVGVPSMIYYPLGLHQQVAYRDFNPNLVLPVTESVTKQILSLPMHPFLTESSIINITNKIKSFYN